MKHENNEIMEYPVKRGVQGEGGEKERRELHSIWKWNVSNKFFFSLIKVT